MKKLRILITTLCLCLGLSFGMKASAEEFYVYDMADLLNAQEEDALQAVAEEYHKRWNINFVAVTTEDAMTLSSKEFADSFYDACYPYEMDDDGCLYLIDMDNQEIYLSTSGNMMEYLTDNDVEHILDEAFYYVAEGDYYGTFQAFFETTEECLNEVIVDEEIIYEDLEGQDTEVKDVVIENLMEEQPAEPIEPFDYSPVIALFLAIIAAFFTRRTIIGKYQMKFVDRDYENDAYSNAKLKVYDKEDRLVNSFINTRRIQTRPVEREEYHSRPVYHSDRVEPRRPAHRPSPTRPHGGSGRSFSSSSGSSRSHGGGGRSFSGSSGSRSSGSRPSGGRSHGGGGRKF